MSNRGTGRGRRAGLAALAICAFALPAEATAASADARPDVAAEQSAAPAAEAAVPAKEAESPTPALPFTGVDALALGALAVSLLATGFVLRRFSTR